MFYKNQLIGKTNFSIESPSTTEAKDINLLRHFLTLPSGNPASLRQVCRGTRVLFQTIILYLVGKLVHTVCFKLITCSYVHVFLNREKECRTFLSNRRQNAIEWIKSKFNGHCFEKNIYVCEERSIVLFVFVFHR